MSHLDILLQGENIADIQLISLVDNAEINHILAEATRLRTSDKEGEFHVFLQDEDEPLKPGAKLPNPDKGVPLSLHVHRCLKIKVAVTFNGKTLEAQFGPARRVGKLKTHFAVKLFGMDRADAAEHVLQLAGTEDRPDPDTHVGSLAKRCAVAFDLVPLVRVEG